MGKGGSFEREVAKRLSLWYTDGEADDLFWRTHASGGRATQRFKKGKNLDGHVGDICAIDSRGEALTNHWSIEIKTGYANTNKSMSKDGEIVRTKTLWSLLDKLDSKQEVTTFEKFWEQCEKQAESLNKLPVLIFRRNGRSACIAMPQMFLGEYQSIKILETSYFVLKFNSISRVVVVMNLNDFFECFQDPKTRFGWE